MTRPEFSSEKLAEWEEMFLKEMPKGDNPEDEAELREIFYAGFWIKEETKCSPEKFSILAMDFSMEGMKDGLPWKAAAVVVQRYRDGYFDDGTRFSRAFSEAIEGMLGNIETE